MESPTKSSCMPQSEIPKVFENNFETSFEQEACGYKPLLYKISVSLGLAQKESSELVTYVCQAECKNYAYQNKNFTPKVWLSKALVRHCVLKINSVMFSQKENSSQTSLIPFYISKIPFSFRLAYILLQSFEFTETEVAQILNLTPMQVRERLSKAMAIVKSYHCKQA